MPKNQIKYKEFTVVKASSFARLIDDVNEKLQEGWELFGEISYAVMMVDRNCEMNGNHCYNQSVIMQAMVLY